MVISAEDLKDGNMNERMNIYKKGWIYKRKDEYIRMNEWMREHVYLFLRPTQLEI